MNIVFLSVEEKLYLPSLFHRVLKSLGNDVRAVYLCPLKHGRQSTLQMIGKYASTFGLVNLMKLVKRQAWATAADRIGLGRGSERFYSIKSVADHHNVPCETIRDVNAASFLDSLRLMKIDLIVSVSCPQLFKKPLIQLPPLGCLNMHGALLPKYRGLSPSFWMMCNGEAKAGVTVFLVNENIDLGDAVETEEFPIHPDETLEQFIIRSRLIHAEALLRAIDKIARNDFTPRTLSRENGSYFSFPTRRDYRTFRRRGRRLW